MQMELRHGLLGMEWMFPGDEMRPTLLAVFGAVIGASVAAPGHAQTPKPDRAALAATGILERLAERTGVYGVPPTAKTPGFIADAGWPQKLPNNWIIGQVGGLYVAPDDHIWIYQRPRTLTNDEAALTDATHKDKDGKPVDVLGFPRPYGVLGDCCVPAPSVMEFDASGKLLRAWGGPADPGSAGWKTAASGRPASTASSSTTTASSISAATAGTPIRTARRGRRTTAPTA